MPPDEPAARAVFEATVDFHRMLSALGDHPALLRLLGLVVDVEVAAGDVPGANYPAPIELTVRPLWQSLLDAGQSTDVTPPTACIHVAVDGETFFGAAERTPNPAAPTHAPPTGLVSLPPAAFAIEQVDVDGAALKALNLAATLNRVAARAAGDDPLEEPDSAGLPALRSGGLALLSGDRTSALQGEFGQAAKLNDAAEGGALVTLHAEDLVRGMRLDVLDAGGWRSLHARQATYTVSSLAEEIVLADEGFFQLGVAGRATPPGQPPDPNGELYVHESVVTWDGWSLSAPRPGKALSRDPRAPTPGEPDTEPQRIDNDPMTAMGLRIEAQVTSGTLPRLRFGRDYRLRLRSVDLAGNGIDLATADRRLALAATDTPVVPVNGATAYARFEPVPAPALAPRARFGEGASLLRLVVRSNAGVSAADYAAAFNAADAVTSGAHPPYEAADERHVIAPKASLEAVEAHGMLDDAIGSDGTPPAAGQVAAMQTMYEIARREKGTLAELDSDPDNPQRYPVIAAEQFELPYLPDPWAVGAMFFDLPGVAPGEPFAVSFDAADWHRPAPLRLRLVEGDGPPRWDPATRVVTVALGQATTASARVCSLFGGALEQMGIFGWCRDTLAPDAFDEVVRAAVDNACWLLTPWHDLAFVHAVQQPLEAPELVEFEVTRGGEATFANVYGVVATHPPSTERIDLVGAWSEPVDDLAEDGPRTHASEQVVFSLPIAVAATGDARQGPHEQPYTLFDGRFVSFHSVIAMGRGLATPAAHQFGDTKHRRVRYRIVAATPFREYFPPDWAQRPELLSAASEVQVVDVPCSAPPATARVEYVVPTLGWDTEDGEGAGGGVRRRRGGGLRVYLSRPWFSSGEGEQLGVVVGYPLTTPSSDDYAFVTLIGRDPIRAAAPLEFARARRFRNAARVVAPAQLRELPGNSVTLVCFDVRYDEVTRRWFCDIELDTELAYMPFVRLSLVRYQEHALARCSVSPVVLCDLVQPLPDRTLTVVRDPADPAALAITLAGPSYDAIRGPLGRRTDDAALGRVVARVQRRDPSIADDELGWIAVEAAEATLARSGAADTTTWSGTLSLPPDDGLARRVAVIEYDHLTGDEDSAVADGLAPRVVYADAFAL